MTERYWVAMSADHVAEEVEAMRAWYLRAVDTGDLDAEARALAAFAQWSDLLRRVRNGGEPWLEI